MKNLRKLCLVLSVGSIAALSITACGDDTPATSNTTAGTGAGGSAAGSGTAGTGTAGTGTAGTGTAGTGTAGTGTAGGGGASGGSGGASGGSGGASAGTGGASGGSGGTGGASGGSSGSGGSGGAASAGCMKLCVGADSIGTICAGEPLTDTIKNSCLAACAKATPMQVTCWNDHVANAKNMPNAKTTHCMHAAGADPCSAWPTP